VARSAGAAAAETTGTPGVVGSGATVIEDWVAHPPAALALAWLAVQAPLQPRFPFRSEVSIERAQRLRVASAVRYACRHVPHYRDAIRRLGITSAELATAQDLSRLPLIERSDLQQHPERFLSSAREVEHYVAFQTGGSSGAPVTVHHDPFALIQAAAFHQRAGALHRKVARRPFGCRMLEIGHPSYAPDATIRRTLARLSRLVGANGRLVSILDPVECNAQEMNRFRPHILSSFGSYLEELFVHLHATGEPFHRPAVVVFDSDAMSPNARSIVSESFGIPVFSVYGAYEAFTLGFECDEHLGYHVNVDLHPVRVVDPDGRDVPPTEPGEVVVSNLINRGTVLLNYRLGDRAAWLPGPCPCGRRLPLLSFVQGRAQDWLVTPSGQPVHAQAVGVALDVEGDILRYQAVQTAPTSLTVRLVTRSASDREALVKRVKTGLETLLGPGLAIDAEFVADLPRTPGGKVRTVVGLESQSNRVLSGR
jgi:phenylacetate-CoA ligase